MELVRQVLILLVDMGWPVRFHYFMDKIHVELSRIAMLKGEVLTIGSCINH
jgi:hypothetical protein